MRKRLFLPTLVAALCLTGCNLFENASSTSNDKISINSSSQKDEIRIISLRIINNPIKTTYNKDEAFEPDGLVVRAYYSDGSSKNIETSKLSISQINQTTGEVVITYEGVSTSFVVSFTQPSKDDEDNPPTQSVFTLLSPINNQSVQIIDSEVKTYLYDFKESRKDVVNDYLFDKECCNEDNYSTHKARVADYVKDNKDHSKAKGVTLSFKTAETSSKYYVVLSTSKDFSNSVEYETTSTSIEVKNLYRNTKYYWKVYNVDKSKVSNVETFITEDTPRFIYTDKLNNVRDYGGYLTKSGKRIKQGLIYRGHEINVRDYQSNNSSQTQHYYNLTDNVKNTLLNDLGIQVEFDLRSVDERDSDLSGSPLGSTVEYKTINSTSGWCPAYHYISSSEKGKYNYKQIKDVFVAISEAASSNKPIYIHCMGGADRTGTIFFLLGGLLGMNFTDLCAEFELTSFAKNLRERDKAGSYSTFPRFIQAFYDDEIGFDTNKTHDIQTVVKTMFLSMGITQAQLDAIINRYLVD